LSARPTCVSRVFIHRFARLAGHEEVAAAIAIEGAEQALLLDHLLQRCHDRSRRFFFDQLRIVDLAGGVVEKDNQVVIAVILKPAMRAAINVQQHARQRPARPPAAMRSALAFSRHQSGALQRLLDPAIAELDALLLAQLFMEMAHVEVEILLLIQGEHLFHRLQRHAVIAALAAPLIKQPVVAVVLVGLPFALHIAHAHARDLGRLDPGQLLGQGFQNHVL